MSKTTYVAGLVVAGWIAIILRLGDNLYINGGLLISGLAASFFAFWYIKSSQDFAQRNPGQALLDGAEFLEWTRLEAAAKGLPSPPNQSLIEVPPAKQGGNSNA